MAVTVPMRKSQLYDEWRWGAGFWLSFGTVLLITAAAFLVEYQMTTSASARAELKFQATNSTMPMHAPRRAKVAQVIVDPEPVASIVSTPTESCNVDECSGYYRSFRSSDCTYQPYTGDRKRCTR